MKSVRFIFGIHNHQPVGNFDFVFEDAYQKSYLPFIETLEEYTDITMAIHFSGCLLEWLEDHHPEYIDRIAKLVKNGNLEILSAGFYEPVLAVIPDHDKIQQIGKMNAYIRSRFDYEPQTAWLTERVWEPHLPKVLKETGIRYVTIDDFHFLSSGKKPDELDGYYLTDEQGFEVGVFPISQRLRYAIPFQEPEKTLEILKDYATEDGNSVVVMADDGEKFGVWPGTHDLCFKKNWLRKFFNALVENSDWIKMTTFRDYGRSNPPRGRAYLPTVSYFEMNEWTLPADSGSEFDKIVHELEHANELERYRPYLRGGTWRNFQSLYTESNWMQKRMTDVSWRLNKAIDRGLIDGSPVRSVQDDLWRSQCNCAYWHGIFGGLYLPHLRHAVYTHLLKAEKVLNTLEPVEPSLKDIDHDGGLECRVFSRDLQVLAGQRGGMIREIDLLDFNFNLANGMRRYAEAYHGKLSQAGREQTGTSIHDQVLVKEPGLENYLILDTYDRASLTDHFMDADTSMNELQLCQKDTALFVEKSFDLEKDDDSFSLRLESKVKDVSIQILKHVRVNVGSLEVTIEIINTGPGRLSGKYGNEWNFSLLGGDTPDRFYEVNGQKPEEHILASSGNHENVHEVSLTDEWDGFRVGLTFPKPVQLWRFPIYTVSMSEAGFEKVYQSSVVIPVFSLDIAPGKIFRTSMTFFLNPIKQN